MPTIAHENRILTPQMLHDRAAGHRQQMASLRNQIGYTDSAQARDLIEQDIARHERQAIALEAEAQTLERDLQDAQRAHG